VGGTHTLGYLRASLAARTNWISQNNGQLSGILSSPKNSIVGLINLWKNGSENIIGVKEKVAKDGPRKGV